MPYKNLKLFMILAVNLESLANGAKKYGSDKDYPAEISEKNIRALKNGLENTWKQYVQCLSHENYLTETYEKQQDDISGKVSGYKSMLYSFYGKKSKEFQDQCVQS